ncbi:OsmC family protein [Paradesulfitobacterium aromaticivorans]
MSKDLQGIFNQVIKAFTKRPELAQAVVQANTKLVENLKTEAQVGNHTVVIDEPQEFGGSDAGPNPLETFLASLGTCQEITYAAYAAVMGIKLDKVEVEVTGDIDLRGYLGIGEAKPGFRKISYLTKIASPEPKDKIQQLAAAVEAHCPVLDSIKTPIEVEGRVEII